MPDTAVVDTAAPSSPAPSAPAPTPATTSGGNSLEVSDAIGRDFDALADAPAPPSPGPIEKSPTSVETQATEPLPAETGEVAPPAVEEPKAAELPAEFADLPEGISVTEDKSGHKTYSIPEEHFADIHNAYAMARQAEEILGEPLTPETLGELQTSRLISMRLETDLLRTDGQVDNEGRTPQDRILYYLSELGRAANVNGHIQHDPMRWLAHRMPEFLAANNPDAYQIQADRYIRRTLDSTYKMAQEENDEQLFYAAQHLDKRVFNTFTKVGEAPRADPIGDRERAVEARERALQQLTGQSAQQRWNADQAGMNQAIRTNIGGVIENTLKPVAKYYEDLKLPHAVEGIRVQLQNILNEAIAKDSAWTATRSSLLTKAQNAVNPAIRQELLEQIAARYDVKASIVLDPRRNAKVREIISQGAVATKASLDASHARNAEASNRREPTGTGATPPRSVMPPAPPNNRLVSADKLREEIESFF